MNANPPPSPPHRLSVDRIREARGHIGAAFRDSPLLRAPQLSARFGCELLLKDETRNPLGCFKGRGADCLLSRAQARDENGPLVCASAGNFGIAMADAAARGGRVLTVFVSARASAAKVEAIRARGARIVVAGDDFDAAKEAARASVQISGARFIEDGVEVDVSEGAGSIAVELLAAAPHLDCVLVPLGNGALLAGMARWIKAFSPTTEMIGVCSAGAPVMFDCWRTGMLPRDPRSVRADSIADGIAVRVPVPLALQDLASLVDDVVLVDDERTLAAMRWLHAEIGLMVEPSAAVGVAAIDAQRARFAGRRVATVLTGANLTDAQRTAWFARA